MKKTTILSLVFMFTLSLNSQVISQFPYFENFENGAGGWTGNGDWQLGTPNKFRLNRAFSGSNTWVTGTISDYSNGSNSILISPRFDFSNRVPILHFQNLFFTESGYDGLIMEYQIGNGSWIKINGNHPTTRNWYNGSISLLGQCWNGSINFNQYLESRTTILSIAGQNNVRFRFYFRSDGSVTSEGFAIDDILIDYSRNDIEAISLQPGYVNPPSSGCQTPPDSLFLVLKNYLHDPVNNFSLGYEINGNSYSTNTTIQGLETKKIYLPPPYNFTLGQNNVRAWSAYNSDQNRSNDSASFQFTSTNQTDMSVQRLTDPLSPTISCSQNTQSLQVELRNLSNSSVNNVSVGYSFNGSTHTEVIQNSIPSYCTSAGYLFRFSQALVFPLSGDYELKVWAIIPNDINPQNDTFSTTLTYVANIELPYLQNFESAVPASGTGSDFRGTFPPGWVSEFCGIREGENGITGTGPNSAYGGRGNYVTFYQPNFITGRLLSPCIEIPQTSNDILLNLKYYLRNSSGFSRINIVDQLNSFNVRSYSLPSGNQISSEDPFSSFLVLLNNFKGTTVRLQFESNDQAGNFSIDDIRLFEQSNADVNLLSIDSPIRSACGTLEDTSLLVQVNNIGTTPISSFELCYQINDENAVCETVSGGTLNPGAAPISYTFNQALDLSSAQDYYIKVYSKLNADSNQMNDTAFASFRNANSLIPYNQEFDSSAVFSSNFEWDNFSGNYNWEFNKGVTPSFNTGPTTDADGNPDGYYAYVESSSMVSAGSEATLQNNNCFNLSNPENLVLEYEYHMYGNSINRLYLQIGDDISYTTIDSLVGQQQSSNSDPWEKRKISLSDISKEVAYFRFIAVKGNGEQGDIAIDNFRIRDSTVSIPEIKNEIDQIKLFPNPANESVTISTGDLQITDASRVRIYNSTGRKVYDRGLDLNRRHQLKTAHFASGIYILQLEVNGISHQKKLLINRP